MVDRLSRERRSWNMSRIRSGGTKPELVVRRAVYALGYRYKLHARTLPGKPDIAFFNRKKAIFVHGCFWHQHDAPLCPYVRVPKSSLDYWMPKLSQNVTRDAQHLESLEGLGWSVLIIWECELQRATRLRNRIRRFLGPVSPTGR